MKDAPRFPNLFPALIALCAAGIVAASAFALDQFDAERKAQMHRLEVFNQLNAVRGKLETGVQSRLLLVRGLVAFVSTHPEIDEAQFRELAKVLIAQQRGVDAIELARNNVISSIYPLQDHEKALGLDLLSQKGERQGILRAISTRTSIISGPVKLAEGGTAFIVRSPVYITEPGNVPEGGSYWGLAQLLMNAQGFLDEAGLNNNCYPGLRIALRGREGAGLAGDMIAGDREIFTANPVLADVVLPDGLWQIAAVPKEGWPIPVGRILRGGLLLAAVVGLLAWLVVRVPARQRGLMEQATADAQRSEARLKKLNRELELRIEVRTQALVQTNQELLKEAAERKQLQDNLQRMAHYDELTKLPNRILFFDRMERTLADCRRNDKGFALLFVDLDGFKKVNDTHGHHVGDQLLQEVARRLKLCVRETDTVVRMGGDEFAIILVDISVPDDASVVAQKIISALSVPVVLGGKDCHIGASIGISLYPHDGGDGESLLAKADGAMYDAKKQGKNSYCFVHSR